MRRVCLQATLENPAAWQGFDDTVADLAVTKIARCKWLPRSMTALCAGAAVGVVLFEGCQALGGLILGTDAFTILANVEAADAARARTWFLTGLVVAGAGAGSMATALSARAVIGCLAGCLLIAPALVLAMSTALASNWVSVAAISPLFGAALATRLVLVSLPRVR